jgi:hypothetical protein
MSEVPATSVKPEAREGLGQALISVVDRPSETMTYAARHPRSWWLPALLIFASLVIVTVVSAPLNAQMAGERIQAQLARIDVPEEQMEQMSGFIRQPSETGLIVSGVGLGGLGLCVGWVLTATILHFSSHVLGGESEFSSMFPAVVWGALPSMLRNLVQAGYVFTTGQACANPGISGLVATGDALTDSTNVLWVLLASLDVCWLWNLLLLAVGFAVVSELSRVKSGMTVVIWWAISKAVGLIPVLVGRGLMSRLGGG